MPVKNMGKKERHYENLYLTWKEFVKDQSHFSKSTAYINNEPFRKIIEQGTGILPFLEQKLKTDDGLDFFLADAVIRILNLAPHPSIETDYGKKRDFALRAIHKN